MINAFHWLGTFLFLAAMGLLIVASVRSRLRSLCESRDLSLTSSRLVSFTGQQPHLGQWCAPFARSDAVNVLSIVALAVGFLHGTLNGQRFTFGNWCVRTSLSLPFDGN